MAGDAHFSTKLHSLLNCSLQQRSFGVVVHAKESDLGTSADNTVKVLTSLMSHAFKPPYIPNTKQMG